MQITSNGLEHEFGVWYECPEVKRFALPAGRAHLTRVIDCVKPVSEKEIHSRSARKPAKHIGVQNVE